MKKTLSVLAVLGVFAFGTLQQAEAFSWSSLNPAYWGHCPKCERQKSDCDCKKKVDKDCPCTTGAAAPCTKTSPCDPCPKQGICEPCQKKVTTPCDACDRLQEQMQNK